MTTPAHTPPGAVARGDALALPCGAADAVADGVAAGDGIEDGADESTGVAEPLLDDEASTATSARVLVDDGGNRSDGSDSMTVVGSSVEDQRSARDVKVSSSLAASVDSGSADCDDSTGGTVGVVEAVADADGVSDADALGEGDVSEESCTPFIEGVALAEPSVGEVEADGLDVGAIDGDGASVAATHASGRTTEEDGEGAVSSVAWLDAESAMPSTRS